MTAAVRNDLGLYDRHANDWWNQDSAFSCSLHEVNRLCLAAIRERLGPALRGSTVIDLGCGGGLLAEPLAQAGAQVIGVDVSGPSVSAARNHGRDVNYLTYLRGDVRYPPLAHYSADVVICADVLEHVDDWKAVLAAAAMLLRPGSGQLFVVTINRTIRARWLAVILGEGLGFVPRGTHDPEMFITPTELGDAARQSGLEADGYLGFAPRLIATVCSRRLRMRTSRSLAVEYGAWFIAGKNHRAKPAIDSRGGAEARR